MPDPKIIVELGRIVIQMMAEQGQFRALAFPPRMGDKPPPNGKLKWTMPGDNQRVLKLSDAFFCIEKQFNSSEKNTELLVRFLAFQLTGGLFSYDAVMLGTGSDLAACFRKQLLTNTNPIISHKASAGELVRHRAGGVPP